MLDELKSKQVNQEQMLEEISRAENEILQSQVLSETRKQTLVTAFEQTLAHTDDQQLFSYFGSLVTFQTIVEMQSLEAEPDIENGKEQLNADLENIVDHLSSSKKVIGTFEQDFQTYTQGGGHFKEEYDENVTREQLAIIEELESLQQLTTNLATQLETDLIQPEEESSPVEEVNPEGLLLIQHNPEYSYVFNHSDIAKVLFEGFTNEEEEEFQKVLADV